MAAPNRPTPIVEEFIDENTLAERFDVSRSCLQKWRMADKGPPVHRLPTGAVRYVWSECVQWASSQTKEPNQ